MAGVASAAAVALAALLGLALSEEPAPLAGPPALADGLAAPPLAAERAAGGAEMLTAGPLLAAFRLPTPRLTGGEMRPSGTAASPAPVSPVAGAEPIGATDAGPGLASGSKLASTAGMALRAVATPLGDHGNPLYELAHRLQRKGETASAIRVYGLAAETDPRHAATFYNWGYLLQQQGHEDAARAKYRQALQIAPQHAFAHYNLAYLLQRAGDDLAAIEHYRAAIAANPRFAWSHYNLGWLEQKLGHHRAALAEYRRSVELDPQQALARQNIATILRRDRR